MAEQYSVDFDMKVNLDHLKESLEKIADSCRRTDIPLLRAGGVVRKRVHSIFQAEGPNWPPLKDATLALKPNMAWVQMHQDLGRGPTGQRTMIQKIVRDHRGARKWLDRQQKLNEYIRVLEFDVKRLESKRQMKIKTRTESLRNQKEKTEKQILRIRQEIDAAKEAASMVWPVGQEGQTWKSEAVERRKKLGGMMDRAAMIRDRTSMAFATGGSKHHLAMERKLHNRTVIADRAKAREESYMARLRFYSEASKDVHPAPRGGMTGSNMIAYAYKEMARAKAHGEVLKKYKMLRQASGGILGARKTPNVLSDRERRAILRQHARRYKATESSTRILGGLEPTIYMKLLNKRTIRIFSSAYISGIHNEGGTAGHGAKIPARPFIYLLDSDAENLARYLTEQVELELSRIR